MPIHTEGASGDEPRLRRRREDPPPCRGDGDSASRAAKGEPESRTGLRPGSLQAAERGRTVFRRREGRRHIYTRFGKLDAMFSSFLNLAFVIEMIYDIA